MDVGTDTLRNKIKLNIVITRYIIEYITYNFLIIFLIVYFFLLLKNILHVKTMTVTINLKKKFFHNVFPHYLKTCSF